MVIGFKPIGGGIPTTPPWPAFSSPPPDFLMPRVEARPTSPAVLRPTTPQKGALIDRLADHTVGPAEAEALRQNLGVVDAGVLALLVKQDLKLSVVHPGDDMRGFFQPVEPKAIETQGEAVALVAQRNDRKYGARQEKLQQQLAQGLLFGQANPERELMKLSAHRFRDLHIGLVEAGIPAQPFLPLLEPIHPAQRMSAIMQAQGPLPSVGMANAHGANNPDQHAEFERLLQALNGDRLTQARREGLEKMRSDPSHDPRSIELAEKDPRYIFIDHRAHDIVVPDLHYWAGTRLKGADRSEMMGWAGLGSNALPNGAGSNVHGCYLEDSNRVLIAQERTHGSTPVHELGHAVDHAVKRADPAFHADWSGRVKQAFDRGSNISEYARTSPAEFVAEGVFHYYHDPAALKTFDPALYQLTEELLQHASKLGA